MCLQRLFSLVGFVLAIIIPVKVGAEVEQKSAASSFLLQHETKPTIIQFVF